MYYIYTIEKDGLVYIGATRDPMSRMYSHESGDSTSKLVFGGKFFLRHSFGTAEEALEKERELVKSLNSVNTVKSCHLLPPAPTRKIRLSVPYLSGKRSLKYVRPLPKIRNCKGTYCLRYNKKSHSFGSLELAQAFVDEL